MKMISVLERTRYSSMTSESVLGCGCKEVLTLTLSELMADSEAVKHGFRFDFHFHCHLCMSLGNRLGSYLRKALDTASWMSCRSASPLPEAREAKRRKIATPLTPEDYKNGVVLAPMVRSSARTLVLLLEYTLVLNYVQ